MSTMEQIKQQLDAKIPRDVIALRDAGSGRKLSYLEGWYVIARMNEIFGQGNWSYTTDQMTLAFSGEVNDKQVAHYIAKVTLVAFFPNGSKALFSDYGYGDGSDKFNPGKAHELAVKEAVTDGIKRCAKSLGMSLGLALYDKSQENVDDGESESDSSPRSAAERKPAARKAAPAKEEKSDVARPVPSSPEPQAPAGTREELNSGIQKISKILEAKKIKSLTEIRELVKTKYGAESSKSLDDAKAAELYAELRGMANG
jgi:DNA recombination protein Rad52